MSTVYIVRGQSGEYDLAKEWLVCGYSDLEMAARAASKLNDWCKNQRCHVSDGVNCDTLDYKEWPEPEGLPPDDVNFQYSFYGVNYDVVSLRVEGFVEKGD